jgi:hypothetical protein
MAHRLSRHRSRPLLMLAGALTTLCVSLALFAPSSASASAFCSGAVRSNYDYCHGTARNLSGVTGHGDQHSVCVGAGALWGGCSGGPNQIATMNLGYVAYLGPWIEVNAPGTSTLWGDTF